MSWLSFIASLVHSLAWPVVALAAIILLRKPIAGLLTGRIKHLKVGTSGLELDTWHEAADKSRPVTAEAQARRLADQTNSPAPDTGDISQFTEQMRDLARTISPSAAVIAASDRLEHDLRKVVATVEPGDLDQLNTYQLADLAHGHHLIDGQTVIAIKGLGVMRLLAAGAQDDLTIDKADEYTDITQAVLFLLEIAAK